jgi:2,4-dienoyl-CoA reductase (NADPH2)
VLIVAAGGKHEIPAIPGIGSRNVLTGMALHRKLKFFLQITGTKLLSDLSKLWLPMLGKRVLIIGAKMHGCQTAAFLVKRGRKVTIVDSGPRDEIGDGLVEIFLKPYLLYWLEDHGVQIIPEVTYRGITSEGLTVATNEGRTRVLAADTIVVALPLLPNSALAEAMQGTAGEVLTIGDSREPGLIFDAIADGARTGRAI